VLRAIDRNKRFLRIADSVRRDHEIL